CSSLEGDGMSHRRWVAICCAVASWALTTAALAEGAERSAGAASSNGKDAFEPRFSAMMGLTQWILFRGGNVAFEYDTGRLAVEVSHGQGLDFDQIGGFAKSAEERRAGAHVRVPWTTGFGAGVRILPDLVVLLEFKAHHYEVRGMDPRATAA